MEDPTPPSPNPRLWGWLFLALAVALLAGGLLFFVRWQGTQPPIVVTLPSPTPSPSVLKVHVAGAVAKPGVYTLAPGNRVEDAIAAAGGVVEGADLHALNLARPLRDGEKVTVPRWGQATPTPEKGSTATGKVNINTASAAELDRLPNIGPVRAQDIIRYREEHGPFQRLEDLLRVPGIGPSILDSLRDLVTLD